ncbi:MAG: 1-(5-phosphoribosyl)-5-[(5-phosphoribosylamino)methylideneamino]imidazole-4-carboxamide isomerase [Candidatus Omnitrophota bacterium]|jgi:phosphoribosylformimino-5-aminoimidazole carboxamide ribotide isomerase
MLIIPAIDLKDGKVVRLIQGRFNQKKVYSADPISTARHWEKQGARYLHVVDLDGAKTGRVCHLDIIKKMVKSVSIPIEFGGGLRNKRSISQILDCGVERAVLGTKLQDEDFLRGIFREFKQRIVTSIDVQNDVLKISGWQRKYKRLSILDLISRLEDIGFKQIICTDIARDGTLKGPNIVMIKKILKHSQLSVIASGGISSLRDLIKLKALSKQGLWGAIVGKALYEARFTLREALKYG